VSSLAIARSTSDEVEPGTRERVVLGRPVEYQMGDRTIHL
jgi:hypothetical protein